MRRSLWATRWRRRSGSSAGSLASAFPLRGGELSLRRSGRTICITSNTSPPGERKNAIRRLPNLAVSSVGGSSTSVPSAVSRSTSGSSSATSKTAWVSPRCKRLGEAVLEDRLRRHEDPRIAECDQRVVDLAGRRSRPFPAAGAFRRAAAKNAASASTSSTFIPTFQSLPSIVHSQLAFRSPAWPCRRRSARS